MYDFSFSYFKNKNKLATDKSTLDSTIVINERGSIHNCNYVIWYEMECLTSKVVKCFTMSRSTSISQCQRIFKNSVVLLLSAHVYIHVVQFCFTCYMSKSGNISVKPVSQLSPQESCMYWHLIQNLPGHKLGNNEWMMIVIGKTMMQ